MKKILLLNQISANGLNLLEKERYEVGESLENPDAILVRSANMHEMKTLERLLAVARAGAGVNNIPIESFSEKGIVVFNTPGANANSVKELTLASLLLAARDIAGGIGWVKTLDSKNLSQAVEKGKKAFAGIELEGKTLGVIGLGAIGSRVANLAASSALGMNVIGYDPYLSVGNAWNLSRWIKPSSSYEEIFKSCDFITLHLPLTDETKEIINRKSISYMKQGVRIINLSRAELVDESALKEALLQNKVARYVTDFPTSELVDTEGVVSIPHLGASTEEAEDNCAVAAVKALLDYLENGNIKNSVNYPSLSSERTTAVRICVLHDNIPAILSKISSAIAEQKINIASMMNASRNALAYTMIDLDSEMISNKLLESIQSIDGVTRVRTID